jgi:hypothetical protein
LPNVVGIATDAGLGTALKEAVARAQFPLLALATADAQFLPDELTKLLAVIDHADLVVGCRSARPIPWWRRFLDRVIGLGARVLMGIPLPPRLCWLGTTGWQRRWVARWLFGLHLHDPECALRLFRREILTRIPLQSKGSFVLVETLAKANHLEYLMTEEAVAWAPPNAAPPENVSWGAEAWRLFRFPDFGPVDLHVPPPDSSLKTASAPDEGPLQQIEQS